VANGSRCYASCSRQAHSITSMSIMPLPSVVCQM
jgi:hypothetical protein